MPDVNDPKNVLHYNLQAARNALVWKLAGVDEYNARVPRTPTGNNLLGLIKHCLNIEVGYFGPTFGRAFPHPEALVPFDAFDDDPQADWYATEHETKDGLIGLYQQVWVFADETIDQLPLDSPGLVPWWPLGGQEVTLQRIMVHVLGELSRHAGHADILREHYDGQVGRQQLTTNLPDHDWAAYTAKLTAIANHYTAPSR